MNYQFIVGSYTRKNGKGIYQLSINPEKQESERHLVAEILRPTYLIYRNHQVISSAEVDGNAGVMIYEVDEKGLNPKQFVHMNEKSSPAHVELSNDGQWLVSSNYHEGCFTIYQKQGETYEPYRKVVEPKTNSHVHQAVFCEQDEWLYVVDLGIDRIKIYDVEADFKFLFELVFPEGFGPRHLVAVDEYIYCLGEYSHQLAVFKLSDSKGELLQIIDTVDEKKENSTSAAIQLSKDRRFIYTSIRGQDQISVFKIGENRLLEKIQEIDAHGQHPRDILLTEDQRYLLVATKDTDNVSVFEVDQQQGYLKWVMEAFCEEGVCLAEIL